MSTFRWALRDPQVRTAAAWYGVYCVLVLVLYIWTPLRGWAFLVAPGAVCVAMGVWLWHWHLRHGFCLVWDRGGAQVHHWHWPRDQITRCQQSVRS